MLISRNSCFSVLHTLLLAHFNKLFFFGFLNFLSNKHQSHSSTQNIRIFEPPHKENLQNPEQPASSISPRRISRTLPPTRSIFHQFREFYIASGPRACKESIDRGGSGSGMIYSIAGRNARFPRVPDDDRHCFC